MPGAGGQEDGGQQVGGQKDGGQQVGGQGDGSRGRRSQADDRRRISSGSSWEPVVGFSRALRVGDRVVVSGTGPVWPDGRCPDDAGEQARRCLAIIAGALAEAGADPADVVRTRMYLVDAGDAGAVGAAHHELFGDIGPAATMVVVAALVDSRWRVEIEAEAVVRPSS